jgi:hypothetical protein
MNALEAAPPFRGVAALSTGLTLRRPRRNGVRCRGWGKPPRRARHVRASLQGCPSKHGSP